MCTTIKASKTHPKGWYVPWCCTTRSDSIRPWAIDHPRRYTVDEGAILNGLRTTQSNEASNLTYSARKMVWTMGRTSKQPSSW